ncbi:MAG: DUF5309 domain-containing protein [Patescibacteria group bacterium]|nr:DUF5309 domain-containing protein [Patescibacteria group bacterium]
MTVPTNTLQVYTQVNIREDLINTIYNVDPYKTPFLNMAKRMKANQTHHEWNTDTLAAQNLSNAAIEGDNPTAQSLAATTRLGNYTQISTKTVQISGTSQAVIAAGGSNKMGYQLLKKSKELKRDMEGILTNNAGYNAGAAGTARVTAGITAYLGTNTVFQTGGTPSGANPAALTGADARTDNSVTAAITEANVDSLANKVFTNSGDGIEFLLVSPTNKQNISKFTGVGTRFTQVEDKTLKTAVDVYQSDFGDIKIIPDIFLARSKDVFAINPQYIRIAYLRTFQTVPLAKTGDSDEKMLLVEYALEVGNEKALGGIFDTTG